MVDHEIILQKLNHYRFQGLFTILVSIYIQIGENI